MNIKSFAHQVVYFCIGLLIIFFQILPLQTTPQNWSGPNVLLVFFAAIVTKRPEYTSSFLIALIFLIEDFFLMRPPGLMSALIVISFHFLKRKIQNQEENSLIFVWVNVAISFNTYSIDLLHNFRFVIFTFSRFQLNTYGNNSQLGSISNFFNTHWKFLHI